MKRNFITHAVMFTVLSCCMMSVSTSLVHADDIELRRLLHGPDRCDHVIGLLMRYGVNNDSGMPALAVPYSQGPIAVPALEIGDLELVSIAQHAETPAGCGPSFDLLIKNCSTRDVCGPHVTVVGLFGRILPISPSTTTKIESLPAGQAVQVTLSLPIESLAMANLNSQILAFNRVLVVIDSFDQFMECNEANNLRMFESSAIPLVSLTSGPPAPETIDAVLVDPQGAAETPVVATPQPLAVATPQPLAVAPVAVDAEPSSPSDTLNSSRGDAAIDPIVDRTSPELRSAIDQFTEGATTVQDAS